MIFPLVRRFGLLPTDLGDPSALAKALTGVEGAYILLPSDPVADDYLASVAKLTKSIKSAIELSKPPRVVVLSSWGAQLAQNTGPIASVRRLEEALANIAAVVFLRPAYFVENWGAVIPVVQAHGVLPSFLRSTVPMPMVSISDIGACVADLLLDPDPPKVVELSGPTDARPQDVADVLTTLVGKTVTVQEAPIDQVVPTFTGMGMGASLAGLYEEMFSAVANGTLMFEGGSAVRRHGKTTLSTALERVVGS